MAQWKKVQGVKALYKHSNGIYYARTTQPRNTFVSLRTNKLKEARKKIRFLLGKETQEPNSPPFSLRAGSFPSFGQMAEAFLEKKPEACESISEIRDALDKIDLEIIYLFAQRHNYVKEIVKFKSGNEGIVASERKEHVLKQRKAWAEELGLDPALMENVFRLLIEKNIQIQFDIYNNKKID